MGIGGAAKGQGSVPTAGPVASRGDGETGPRENTPAPSGQEHGALSAKRQSTIQRSVTASLAVEEPSREREREREVEVDSRQ